MPTLHLYSVLMSLFALPAAAHVLGDGQPIIGGMLSGLLPPACKTSGSSRMVPIMTYKAAAV